MLKKNAIDVLLLLIKVDEHFIERKRKMFLLPFFIF